MYFIGKSLLLITGLISIGGSYQFFNTQKDLHKNPALGQMINLGKYSLHMLDQGVGSPVVVMDTGIGGACYDWYLVQSEIAKFTRVITYDRAGYGWSDRSPLIRTSENIVEELYSMLKKANIPGPYILVGASFGGLNVRLFADKHPEDVLGIILVDATHEDTRSVRSNENWMQKYYDQFKKNLEVRLGFYRWYETKPDHLEKTRQRVEKYPKHIQDIFLTQRLMTKRIETAMAEESLFNTSSNQVKIKGGNIGTKPLIVITAGKKIKNDGRYTDEQFQQKLKLKNDLQLNLLTKSLNSMQIIAEKSGHNIAYDQPEILVQAVYKMVHQLRSSLQENINS